jgi:hypothetical protein
LLSLSPFTKHFVKKAVLAEDAADAGKHAHAIPKRIHPNVAAPARTNITATITRKRLFILPS